MRTGRSRGRKAGPTGGEQVAPLLPSSEGICALCGREVAALTKHHLRPRAQGGTETAPLCTGCHRQVHALYTNRTLAGELASLERLREEPQIQRYLAWARRQSDRRIPVRTSRTRR
ncbi:MAG TPA: HNH endonuclease [Armatimonadota bacterium]|nr:HNH endonuclease [Armatimonadota bacterium]